MSIFGDYSLNNFTQAISISGEQTMDNKKFESLIELIINENEEQARALFHDIVVEKSREIYESMMYEEAEDLEEAKDEELEEGEEDLEEGMDDMGGGSMDTVEGLLDEIGVEEEGMVEDEEEFGGEEEFGDEGDMGEESLEDRVVDLEDKLDELMAEFEEMMGDEGGDEFGGDEEGMDDMGDEEGMDDMGDEDEEAAMMEAVQLQKVSVTHGDNGVQTKSPVSGGSKVSANGAKAVNFTSGDGGKGGTQGGLLNPATKDVKGAGQFKNAPGGKKADLEAAPKPKHGDDGADKRSPVAESKKSVKRIIKK